MHGSGREMHAVFWCVKRKEGTALKSFRSEGIILNWILNE